MGNIHRRRLFRCPALYPLATVRTITAGCVIATCHHLGGNDVLHDTVMRFHLCQLDTALGAASRPAGISGNRHIDMLIDMLRHGTQRCSMANLAAGPPAELVFGHIGFHK